MYHPFSLLLLLLLLPILLASTASSANVGNIATYWGRNKGEWKLAKACATGTYDFVNIAFLTTFGGGRSPVLDLSAHCNATAPRGCLALGREIRACQKRGVRVMLSLGGEGGHQALDSPEDARQVAEYLHDSFLGGKSPSVPRPFGVAVLDGVDFSVAGKGKKERAHWEDLARALANYSSAERKVYLTAAPQCAYPDKTLKRALDTGVFDMVWVRFYNYASCQYSDGGLVPLKLSWERWNARLQASRIFMGLPASAEAADGGYLPPGNFTADVLPFISNFPKYGGVMLWDMFHDAKNGYSEQVKCEVKSCAERSSV